MKRTAGIYLEHENGLCTEVRKERVIIHVDLKKKNTYIRYCVLKVLNVPQMDVADECCGCPLGCCAV